SNASGGGIYQAAGAVFPRNTIIDGNGARNGPDIWGHITSQGYNLIGSIRDVSNLAECDILDANPLLGPLQNNGGPTQTIALLPGSPAVDAGDNSSAPATDQRGLPRIVGGIIDIGAFEVQIGNVASLGLKQA